MSLSIRTVVALFILALLPTAGLAAPSLDMEALGRSFSGGWNDKDKTAAKYKSGDSNYRTYKPTTSPTPEGGLFVSTKLNHIRGMGGDDFCILELTFDANGKIISAKSAIEMGNKKFDTGIITAATNDERAKLAEKVFNKLADQIARWGEHGGRKNFPAVIQHNINRIAAAVRP